MLGTAKLRQSASTTPCRLGHPAAEESRQPRHGPYRAEDDRHPHHLVPEAGAVVLEVDFSGSDQRADRGESREAALETAGPHVANQPVDALDRPVLICLGPPRADPHWRGQDPRAAIYRPASIRL